MAAKILGLHIRNSKNIGDRNCHPLDYFKLAEDQMLADVREIPTGLKPDIVVVGGGAIAYMAPAVATAFPRALLVAWGIGHSERKLQTVSLDKHEQLSAGYTLWGSRDYLPGFEHVPCASCMHKFFDNVPAPIHKAVVFGHAGVNPLKDEALALKLPYFDNTNGGGLEAALRHIASGEIVVSSSYHGALWGVLMGRKVAMVPFGTKFFSMFRVPPAARSVEEGLRVAASFPNALRENRELNNKFSQKVEKLLRVVG